MVDITIEQAEVFLRKVRKTGGPRASKTDVQLVRKIHNASMIRLLMTVLPMLLIWVPFVNAIVQEIGATRLGGVSLGSVYFVLLIPLLGFSYLRVRQTSDILVLFESQGPQNISDLKPDRERGH